MAVISGTFTGIPTSFDSTNSTYDGVYNSNNPENGLSDQNSSTRACVYANTGSNAVSKLVYNFDCSSIPQNATITSVSCIAAGACYSNGQYFTTKVFQLYNGNTAKGSSTTITGNGSTKANHTINGGSWTRSELDSIKLVEYIARGTSDTNTQASFSFWGATLTVEYSYENVTYNITSTLATDEVDSIDPEGVTEVNSGDSYTLNIYASTISNVIVEDNGTDVTSQLVERTLPSSGTSSTVLGTYTLVSGSFNGQGASYFQGIVGNGVNASQTTSNYYSSGSGTIAVFTYNLSFSNIPSNATITRLYCQVNGHAESTSQSNEYMCVQLRSGNTELSNELNFKSIGTSNSTQTIEATTLPTLSQLSNLVLYCRLGYYGGAINGATCYVEYSIPSSGSYWEYSLSNVNTAHTIIVSSVIVPPEEDPAKTYYNLTVSSVNASTEPGRGTTRVESGTSETITITPSDPQLTLALDNGVDITSQLVAHGGSIEDPTITTAPGASYGFNLNSSTGYYVSTNNGIGSSASVARVTFNLPVRCLVTIQYINYAEETYDFGVFGKIDTTLSTSGWTASQSGGDTTTDSGLEQLRCNTSTYNSSNAQTLTYEIPSGTHYIDIKYGKDQSSDSNNDSLQWKITSIEPLETNLYYTYDLSNISQEHSLIFIFGDVTYYFVNSSTNSDCTLYPNGQMVQLPRDSYRLTIAPKNSGDTITVTDNNVDVTSQLERKEVTTEKDGQTITVVNYIYRLSNIQATHNLVVSSASQGLISSIKSNGQWDEGELKRKQDDRWGTLSYTRIWVHNGTAWIENAQRTITTNGMIFGGALT